MVWSIFFPQTLKHNKIDKEYANTIGMRYVAMTFVVKRCRYRIESDDEGNVEKCGHSLHVWLAKTFVAKRVFQQNFGCPEKKFCCKTWSDMYSDTSQKLTP
jgi:hypothetical protein